jgi:RND family efflux transporter MFP subunit
MRGKTERLERGVRSIITVALLATAVAGVNACRRGDASAEPAGNEPTVIGPENVVVVTEEDIRTGPALSGTLAPEREATIRSELTGPVLQTLIEQGQHVTEGQLLIRLDDTAIRDQVASARSAVTTAQANLTVAQREQERNEALLKAGAIAERAVEQSRAQVTAAQAQLSNAQAQLASAEKQLANTRITAPFTGIVSARSVSVGDVVSP